MLLESQHAEKQIVFTRLFCLPVSVGTLTLRATTARKRVKRKGSLLPGSAERGTDCSSRISRLVLLQNKNSGRVPEVREGTAADLICLTLIRSKKGSLPRILRVPAVSGRKRDLNSSQTD